MNSVAGPFADDSSLSLEEVDQRDTGTCDHCGHDSHVVHGFVNRSCSTRAAYFVHWTIGVSEHPANFDLIIGDWGDAGGPEHRVAVSLLYRNDSEQRAFTVIDATGRIIDSPSMVSHALTRAELIGTPLATEVYELADFILRNDSRIGTIETMPVSS